MTSVDQVQPVRDAGGTRAPVGLADSPTADEALRRVLEQLEASDEGFVHLVTLTDEELVAYSDDPQEATPFGQWYSELSPAEQELAQTAALRTQTANDRFVFTREEEGGDVTPLVPPEVLAVLALKRRAGDPVLTATRLMQDDVAWMVYRVIDGLWLRELVTLHGYHTFALVAGDTDEAPTMLAWAGVSPEAVAAEGVDARVPVDRASDPDAVPFLDGCTAITTFVRLYPDGSQAQGDVFMTHVTPQDQVVAAAREPGDHLRYLGVSGADLAEDFRSWRARW